MHVIESIRDVPVLASTIKDEHENVLHHGKSSSNLFSLILDLSSVTSHMQ